MKDWMKKLLSITVAVVLIASAFVAAIQVGAIGENTEPTTVPTEAVAPTEGGEMRFEAPVIGEIKGAAEGVFLSWSDCGAEGYGIYRLAAADDWTEIGQTAELSFTDTTAVSGVRYTYAVCCISADGETVLSDQSAEQTIDFVRIPTVKSIDNTPTGSKITWNRPDGAAKCRLYYKSGGTWKMLCETADTSYVHDKLTDGATYTYTVRGVDEQGRRFVTDFDREGWSNMFIKPPVITSLTNTAKGVEIRWDKRPGTEMYRVYTYGANGWTRMADTFSNVYVDSNVASGTQYSYTVRCTNAEVTRFTSSFYSGKKIRYIGVPTIGTIENTPTGTKLTWKKPAGAERFRVYVKNGNDWSRLTETSNTSYVHDKLTDGKRYTYTIRCVDSTGRTFASDFDRNGWSNTFIKPPVISSLTNTEKGVEIRWNKCPGAEKYRVYYYGANGWTKMTDTTSTYYVDTKVTSGSEYTYTVRCITATASRFTSSYNSGKKIRFIGVPKISAVENTRTGAKLTWTKPAGAVRFRVYVKNGADWSRLTETTGTSYVHDNLTGGRNYTYTVRCVDSTGRTFVSGFDHEGRNNTFIAPPVLESVSRSGSANLVKWKAVGGIVNYRVYRKGFGGSWGRICDSVSAVFYSDTSAKANTLYAYTVRCLDARGQLVSGYYESDTYYYNGKLAEGSISVNGNSLYFEKGKIRKGYQKINGKTYYYNASGVIGKNGIVGSASEGYCYADKNGVIDYGYCNGVTYNGADWNVINGKAKRVSSESDRTLFRALKLVARLTNSSMTKERKLRICFDHLQKADYVEKNPRIPDYNGMDWPIIYANDIFVDHVGNCLSFAAAFAYMARAVGYENVYGCHSGGHGWTEINGLVYDPEWGMHHSEYSYYGMSYYEPCDVKYRNGISAGYAWMHIKIQ